jgi:hypothetical protein
VSYKDDVGLAMLLFHGDVLRSQFLELTPTSRNDLPKLVYLSRKTKPTEDEARRALCRVLRDTSQRPPAFLLEELARVFDPQRPRGPPGLKAVLKKRSKGHRDPWRDAAIGYAVFKLRVQEGKSYEEATMQIAEAIGKSIEHVKRIYGKSDQKHSLPKRVRKAPR